MMTVVMKLKTFAPWKESYDKPRQYIKKQRHHFADKGLYSQSYGFSSSHICTVARQVPLSMGVFQARVMECGQLPFPSPGDLPNPGIKPRSPTLHADSLLAEP